MSTDERGASGGVSGLLSGPARLDFIDAHRGLAVVLMIWMHSADAWLPAALKTGYRWNDPWNLIRSAGGLAAPTFLLLAGTSCGIGLWRAAARAQGAGSAADPAAEIARGHVARGLQLIVLGYALRLQMWLVDAGGARLAAGWLAAVALGLGYFWTYRAIDRLAARERVRGLALCAVVALAAGFAIASGIEQPAALSLLRVDVLQAIGASLVIVGAVHRPLLRVPWLGVALGAGIALATHYVRELVPGALPVPLAAYLAQWPPSPGRSYASLFPLFPWLAYALVGVSVGRWLAVAAARGHAQRAGWIAVLAGVPLAVLACEPLPFAKAVVGVMPESLHLVRVVYRVGMSFLLMGFAIAFTRPRVPFGASLRTLGQASLFVYWAHLQLTFGVLAKPLAHSLELPAWAFGFALLTVLMTLLAGGWLTLRARLGAPPAAARSAALAATRGRALAAAHPDRTSA